MTAGLVQRWGEGGHGLPDALTRYLNDAGVRPRRAWPAMDLAGLSIRPSRIPADGLDAFGCEYDLSDLTRLQCSGGFSFVDLCHRRWPDAEIPVVDAVAVPVDADQVRALLAAAQERGWVVVPFGAGTSVVNGIAAADRITVGLAMWAMNQVIDLDPVSGVVRVGPGITGPELEQWLAGRGFTWGHLPQSWERASIGGYVATRSSGQASTGYGRSDATVTSLKVTTPRADFALGKGPASAAGPDLRQVFIGSEGSFGVITEVGLRVRPLPEQKHYEGVLFPTFAAGVRAFRALAQERATADVMRLSDPQESEVNIAMSGLSGTKKRAFDAYTSLRRVSGGCLAILGWEGPGMLVASRRKYAHQVFRRFGGVSLGASVGRSWLNGRFSGPYLRDDLLDSGYLVETLETANDWSQLDRTYRAVRQALTQELGAAVIGTHLSHIYPTGASLYFTVIAAMNDDPITQWRAAKSAATDAIVATGATITHHHAVGRDHAPWLSAEIGQPGVDLLAAIKQYLDPDSVMNPGVLGLGGPA